MMQNIIAGIDNQYLNRILSTKQSEEQILENKFTLGELKRFAQKKLLQSENSVKSNDAVHARQMAP